LGDCKTITKGNTDPTATLLLVWPRHFSVLFELKKSENHTLTAMRWLDDIELMTLEELIKKNTRNKK